MEDFTATITFDGLKMVCYTVKARNQDEVRLKLKSRLGENCKVMAVHQEFNFETTLG